MSIKEEKFVLLNNEFTGKILTSDSSSNLLIKDNKLNETFKSNINVLSEKSNDGNIIISLKGANEIGKLFNSHSEGYVLSCSVCQNLCKSCKSICVTCKSPCFKCSQKNYKNSSSDTDDFDKYLDSLSKKLKIQLKVKTVGTDTCDLEGHFDYYKLEKKTVRIQKHVATDCTGLNIRKPDVKKLCKNSVAVDTSDLAASLLKNQDDEESDCEFFWNEIEETKTYSKKSCIKKVTVTNDKQCVDNISENSLIIDEDSLVPTIKGSEDNKENYNLENNLNEAVVIDSSASEESDIDLATSCKVLKCKQLAKNHNIKLKRINNENEVVFKCSICEKTFHKKYLGVLHLGNHIESSFLKCLNCNEKFSSLDLLYSHVKKQHPDGIKNNNNKSGSEKICEGENKENSEIDLLNIKVNKVFKCTLCPSDNESGYFFESSKALCEHKRKNHKIEKVKESEGEPKTEKKQRVKREFICLLCGKQFKSSKALKDHAPVHTGEKNYHCDICNKSYTTSANLKIHKRTHTGARDFVCSVCEKAFHKKDSLKVHFRKHSGERPFQCDLCPMKFDRNYILKNHRYTHFSEKTFICPVCGKTFTTHGGLNNHEKSHKKDPCAKKPRKPAVKPTLDTENAVICDVCGKIYSTKNNLRIHKFVHLGVKPFECTICHQTYAKKDSMLIHMRKHTDERPFACETCGMTFYRNHTLKTHLLRHTGERPHKCKMCGKSFTQSSSLTYHIRNHDKKVEKKKLITDDMTKQKKKRISQGNFKTGTNKKIQKLPKQTLDFPAEDIKPLFVDKKPEESSCETSKDHLILNLPEKGTDDIVKGGHFMLPVPEKEVLILDKNLGIEFPRASGKELDFFGFDKDISFSNQYNLGKFNYYIAKSHVFSFPKETVKPKIAPKEIELSINKSEEDVENLIISKNSYITKEGNLVTLNREHSVKEVKEELVQVGDQRLDLKPQTAVPITGEILNAAFISDESGDVIPLGSMTLHGLNAENIMISPFIPVETDDRKGLLRNSKLAVLDSKIAYMTGTRTLNDKNTMKGNSHVINLKDPRFSEKIQIELEPNSLHIQTPATDDAALNGMTGYFSSVQQNEI